MESTTVKMLPNLSILLDLRKNSSSISQINKLIAKSQTCLTNTIPICLDECTWPYQVPGMNKKFTESLSNKDLIKFLVPKPLKDSLLIIALERNISLSALMRLITSEYSKRYLEKWLSQSPIKKEVLARAQPLLTLQLV